MKKCSQEMPESLRRISMFCSLVKQLSDEMNASYLELLTRDGLAENV